jgi:hypothetical protein
MATRRKNISKRRNKRGGTMKRGGKKWVTAIQAGDKTLEKTGSLHKAKKQLRSQALMNARKLFGSIGKTL